MENKKIFTSETLKEIFYKVIEEFWLDNVTYVVIFQEMTDIDGDTYHIEAEYHKDEEKVTYTRVYDYESIDAELFVSPCFKKQINKYILEKIK